MKAGQAPEALAVWNQKALRSIKRNRKEFLRLIRSMRDVDMYSEGGIYLGTATECRFEASSHDLTVRRLTRGLYWHHFGEVLAFDAPIDVTVIAAHRDNWADGIADVLVHMHRGSVGAPSVFEYIYGRAQDCPTASLWLFKFYGSHVVMGTTGPATYEAPIPILAPASRPEVDVQMP